MDIKKLGVLGFGQMGTGITQVCAQSGYEVIAVDSSEQMVAKGVKGIGKRPTNELNSGYSRTAPSMSTPLIGAGLSRTILP